MSARELPALNALRAFEATARHGTLSRAADELFVTPSAIGHQVRGLEAWLGATLFKAEGRVRRLTTEGERLASVLSNAFDQIDFACKAVRGSRSTEFHINVTPTFAIRWLVPRLGRFQERHPEVSVRIATSARPIDLEREDLHAALRFGSPPWTGMAADLLFKEDVFPVCHPRLLEGPHGLIHPRYLKFHTLLHTTYRKDDWSRWLKAAGLDKSDVDPWQGTTFDLTTMALDAAETGIGVAITREAQVSDALNRGVLVAPFRRDLLRGEGCYFITRPERQDEPQIVAFRTWLMEEAAQHAHGVSQTTSRRAEPADLSV